MINYEQWRSRADFETMQKNPEAGEHMKKAAAPARFEPIVCDVASSFSA